MPRNAFTMRRLIKCKGWIYKIMSDYPNFTRGKIPDMPSGLLEKLKEYEKRQMVILNPVNPTSESLWFEEFEKWSKDKDNEAKI